MLAKKKEFTELTEALLNDNPFIDREQFRKSIKVDMPEEREIKPRVEKKGEKEKEDFIH